MPLEEKGVVLETGGDSAVVKADGGSHCAGCEAAGHCQGSGNRGDKTVEALNDIGARSGDRVVISVPSGDFLKVSFQVYMVPVIGILAGAAAAQEIGKIFLEPGRVGLAAGIGGIAGALAAIALVKVFRSRRPGSGTLRPRIVRILEPQGTGTHKAL